METTTTNNEEQTETVKLLIRTARSQKEITVEHDISIKDLRLKTAELFEVESPTLTVLIFGGKILKDHEDLKTHSIQDGQTVHLVIRTKPPENNSNTNSSATANQQANAANTSNDSSTNNLFSGGLNEIQQRLQQLLISNPETMQNVINPMMQQLSNNPELLRSLFGGMRGMRQIMERNPELNHVLSNPDSLRESLEMVRNPAALQEVMRNYDRALNNMESTPGGLNVLRRIYTELQEPLIDAMNEQMTNQFASDNNATNDSNQNSATQSEQQQTENRDPLPNPWASNQTSNNQSLGSGLPNINDPNLRPLMQATLEALGNNPELMQFASQALSNPAGGGGSDNQSAINELQPAMNQMFQNPEFISLMSNPEAIRSISMIQEGLENLQRLAPNLLGQIGFPNSLLNLNSQLRTGLNNSANSAQTDTSGQTNANQLAQQLLSGLGTGQNTDESTRNLLRMFSQAQNPPVQADSQPPEERYRAQLEQLNEMGFTNRDANIQALIASLGNVEAAIARLLG